MTNTQQPTQTYRLSLAGTTAFTQASRLEWVVSASRQTGVTPSRRRIARDAFENSLRDLIIQEDRYGVEHCAWVSDLLTSARQAAMDLGLLTAADVCRIESEAVA